MDNKTYNEFRDALLEEIRLEMARQNISRAELSRRLGRNRSYVTNLLNNIKRIDLEDIFSVCNALELAAYDLMTRVTAAVSTPESERAKQSLQRPSLKN